MTIRPVASRNIFVEAKFLPILGGLICMKAFDWRFLFLTRFNWNDYWRRTVRNRSYL